LTARLTSRADAKAGLSDPVVACGSAIAQRIKPASSSKPFSGWSRQATNLEQVGILERGQPGFSSRNAGGQLQGRLDGLAVKAMGGRGRDAQKHPRRREEGEPGGGKAQEGIERCLRLNPGGVVTDPGEEQALKAGRRFAEQGGQPLGSDRALTTRVRAVDETVRLHRGESP